ncbi:unnamed protein product [Rangifer tarandus platyrhynchus]|uniref:Uncharacterized protein n=2 Tax=Rangifer tarandus platyrhynchus TaxID=3082113 RepID=A0ABN9A201_RANTA|nr:unnamed protein product [Rangifer tarandus platyrhynchus]CAI9714243.1 unnamed protein product [Rangifer tarandus platyrhynchus]
MSGLAALLHGGSSVAQASRWDSDVGLGQEGTKWPATSGLKQRHNGNGLKHLTELLNLILHSSKRTIPARLYRGEASWAVGGFAYGKPERHPEGSRETPVCRAGSRAAGAGVGRPQAGPVLEAQSVHLRGLENFTPGEEKEDGISPGVGTGPGRLETMAPGASTTPPLLRRELNTLEIGV